MQLDNLVHYQQHDAVAHSSAQDWAKLLHIVPCQTLYVALLAFIQKDLGNLRKLKHSFNPFHFFKNFRPSNGGLDSSGFSRLPGSKSKLSARSAYCDSRGFLGESTDCSNCSFLLGQDAQILSLGCIPFPDASPGFSLLQQSGRLLWKCALRQKTKCHCS